MPLTCGDLVRGKCYKNLDNISASYIYGTNDIRPGTYLGKYKIEHHYGSGGRWVVGAGFSNGERVRCERYNGTPHTFEEVECTSENRTNTSENKTKAGGKRKTRRAQRKRRSTRARK